MYVCVTVLAWKLKLWLPLYTEFPTSGRFCPLYLVFICLFCFYCLTCFSPFCSLIISIICFDWISEITYLGCAVFLPLDFMTPLFSWLSCPCKLFLLFCPGLLCHVLLAARRGCGAFLWWQAEESDRCWNMFAAANAELLRSIFQLYTCLCFSPLLSILLGSQLILDVSQM